MMAKKRLGILTGGGDVQPLNAVIAAAVESAKRQSIELVGFLNGWQGILNCSCISLSRTKIPKDIGGTILHSSRVNVKKIEGGAKILRSNLEKMNIDGLIVIGGEDTLSNSFLLMDYPQILISKTIDNDVGIFNKHKSRYVLSGMVNHFTLGHPTAARKIASFVSLQEGLRTTAYSHERIIVVESMGMHAGWLALSSCMGNPDFIIVPEFPLLYESFLQKVVDLYKKNKNVIIVIAEGARWVGNGYVSAEEDDKDEYGHPHFKGAAETLSTKLKNDLGIHFNPRNVNAVNPSYLYRSGYPCDIDLKCATLLGKRAVQLLANNLSEPTFLSLTLQRRQFVVRTIQWKSVASIENFHRFINDRLYDADHLCATKDAINYWKTFSHKYREIPYRLERD